MPPEAWVAFGTAATALCALIGRLVVGRWRHTEHEDVQLERRVLADAGENRKAMALVFQEQRELYERSERRCADLEARCERLERRADECEQRERELRREVEELRATMRRGQ